MKNKETIRTCCACRRKALKPELLRVVRLPDGTAQLDDRQKMSGRGVYLCRNPKCLEKARRSGAMERSISAAVPEDVMEQIREVIGNE